MRIKTGPTRKQRHNKILDQAKGYRMSRNRLYKKASEAVLHAGQYAFAGRKNRKRDFRQLWITRINGALSETDLSYSRFIAALKKAKIELDRKILSDLVTTDPKIFQEIVKKAKTSS